MTPSAFAHSASVQPSGSLFGTCDFPQILMESLFGTCDFTLFAVLVLKAAAEVVWDKNIVGWLVIGDCCWSGVRGKYYWLAGGAAQQTG